MLLKDEALGLWFVPPLACTPTASHLVMSQMGQNRKTSKRANVVRFASKADMAGAIVMRGTGDKLVGRLSASEVPDEEPRLQQQC
jgi:hypothetical protein